MKSRLVFLVFFAIASAQVGMAAPAQLYPLTVLSDNPTVYWRLDEFNTNTAHDQVGGHDCFLTNVQLNAIGYNPVDSDTAAIFGVLAISNSYAGELDKSGVGIANLDFSRPAGSNAEFSVEAWVRGNPQTLNAGIVVS